MHLKKFPIPKNYPALPRSEKGSLKFSVDEKLSSLLVVNNKVPLLNL